MKSWTIISLAIAVLIEGLGGQAAAYETPTHSDISHKAIDRSVLMTESGLLDDLGIDGDLDQKTFPSEVPVDANNPVPGKTFYLLYVPVRRIIKAGAVLEDRSSNSLHHFYDLLNGGRGLTLGSNGIIVRLGIASPDWILEVGDGGILSKVFRQDFSYSDSLGYFYKALTSNQVTARDVNFGLMFRGIGHLIHHIQDMAQPQHVRNDQHCDGAVSVICKPADNPSHYEKYTNEFRRMIIASSGLYPIPGFPLVRQYWDNASGSGLAEFTQSNFISQGTNFEMDSTGILTGNHLYPLPVPYLEAATYPVDLLTVLQQSLVDPGATRTIMQDLQCNVPLVCMVDFIPGYVFDYGLPGLDGVELNRRASSISLLDNELRQNDIPNAIITTYNRLNFHAAYPFLISRAIAYSAGLINHFFRGRLLIEGTELDQEDNVVVTVANNSSPGNTFRSGSLELYYESSGGGRKPVPQFRISAGGFPLAVGESLQLTVTVPTDLDDELEEPYLLVYNAVQGQLGAEAGIAAIKFDISIPGRVDRLSRGASNCPDRVYGVSIVFPEQPENNGQVRLGGQQSMALFDFTNVPAGAMVYRADALWRHQFDEFSGQYRYEVTYRYNESPADPCTSPLLGPWVDGEQVKVLPMLD